MAKKLRTVDLTKGYFKADGVKWFIEDSISVARYIKFEELSLEFGFNASFVDIFNNLRKLWDNQNQMKFAENSVVLHNMMTGIVDLEAKKTPTALRICALFINEEHEDRTEYSEAKIEAKIARWGELDIVPFFHLAMSLVRGFLPAYEIATRLYSREGSRDFDISKPKGRAEANTGTMCCSK